MNPSPFLLSSKLDKLEETFLARNVLWQECHKTKISSTHSRIWVAVSILSAAMAQLQGTFRGNGNPRAGGQAGFSDTGRDDPHIYRLHRQNKLLLNSSLQSWGRNDHQLRLGLLPQTKKQCPTASWKATRSGSIMGRKHHSIQLL